MNNEKCRQTEVASLFLFALQTQHLAARHFLKLPSADRAEESS